MLKEKSNIIDDFISLVFPDLCAGCGNSLLKNEKAFCLKCEFSLPRTNFEVEKNNKVEQLFWGKVTIESAMALYQFNKGDTIQNLMHELKYKGNKKVGEKLGYILGNELKICERFANIDLVIPCPLHPKKQKKRGYNQAECISSGIALAMNIDHNTTSLVRNIHTESQTKKSVYERFENVNNIFKIIEKDSLIGKHILLVDDVITTGSTMVACLEALSKVNNIKLSVATVAVA